MIWLGIVLAVFASMTGTAGKQCLRLSQLYNEKGTRSALFLAKVSLASGFFLNVLVGPFVDMGSYAFAPQSVIAPLGGLDVVWNTLTAPCTLGERLTPSLLVGCVLISGGATGTSFFGSKEEKDFNFETMRQTLFRWAVFVYLMVLLAWLAFNIIVLIPRSAAPKGEPFKTGDKLRGLSLGMTAGSIAGNMFCVKALVEILQASISDGTGSYWLDWLPYVVLVGAVFFATSNLYFLTKAMREYEALFMGAVFEGTLIIAACVSGVVVFSELESLEVWQISLYWVGVGGVLAGIILVTYGCTSALEDIQDTVMPDDVSGMANASKLAGVVDIASSQELNSPRTQTPHSALPEGTISGLSVLSKRSATSNGPFRELPMVVTELAKERGRYGGGGGRQRCEAPISGLLAGKTAEHQSRCGAASHL